MRTLLAVTGCALAGWFSEPIWAQSEGKPETLLTWHSAGVKALANEKEMETFHAVAALPETARLRDELLQSCASNAAARFTRETEPGPASEQTAALIKPLLNQLIDSEVRAVLVSPGAEKADWALAVKASGDTATIWSTNLWKLAASSRMAEPASQSVGNQPGWIAKGTSYSLLFSHSNEWVLLAGGHSSLQIHEKALAALKQELGKQGDYTLKADVNLPAFSRITKNEKLSHAPRFSLVSAPRADGFRSEMKLDYPKNLGIKPQKWEVPKELVRDPLIAFTAVQGIKERLSEKEEFTGLKPAETPNQLFIWSQSHTPFSITAAAKVGNTKEFVQNMANRVIHEKNPELKKYGLGELRYNTNYNVLTWTGLPIIVPFARPGWEPHDEYVTIGLFPLSEPETNAAPAALFEQLEKENLVYYAWEITGARIAQWRPLWQMSRFLRDKTIPGPESASEKWLPAIAPKLENTVTEATLEGPRSLKIIRQSQLGFTALELVLLAHLADRPEPLPSATQPAPDRPKPGQRPKSPPALNPPRKAGGDQ